MDIGTVIDWAMQNPANAGLCARLRPLALPQCHITAGCLFQPAWNRHDGRPAGWGVKDYDVFYYDASDLSWEAENRVIERVGAACADLGVTVEVKNQARVHLWYGQRFGAAYPPLGSARDGIDRYLIACTCIGLEVASGTPYAPNGVSDLVGGQLRINPRNRNPALFRAKAEAYRARWTWLTIADIAEA